MGAWIEIKMDDWSKSTDGLSHPTMGAWIEIELYGKILRNKYVAPHDGCVD